MVLDLFRGWREQRSCLLPHLHSVAFPSDIEGDAVVQHPVEDGTGYDVITQDFAPFAVRLVRCEDRAALLVPSGHQLEEEVGPLPVHRQVSYLVHDQQLVSGQLLQGLLQAAPFLGRPHPFHQGRGRDVEYGIASLYRRQSETDGYVRLPDAWRTEEYDVLLLRQEAEGAEIIELAFVDRRLEAQVEVLQPLAHRQVRQFRARVDDRGPPCLDLLGQEAVQHLEEGALAGYGIFQRGVDHLLGGEHL